MVRLFSDGRHLVLQLNAERLLLLLLRIFVFIPAKCCCHRDDNDHDDDYDKNTHTDSSGAEEAGQVCGSHTNRHSNTLENLCKISA